MSWSFLSVRRQLKRSFEWGELHFKVTMFVDFCISYSLYLAILAISSGCCRDSHVNFACFEGVPYASIGGSLNITTGQFLWSKVQTVQENLRLIYLWYTLCTYASAIYIYIYNKHQYSLVNVISCWGWGTDLNKPELLAARHSWGIAWALVPWCLGARCCRMLPPFTGLHPGLRQRCVGLSHARSTAHLSITIDILISIDIHWYLQFIIIHIQ